MRERVLQLACAAGGGVGASICTAGLGAAGLFAVRLTFRFDFFDLASSSIGGSRADELAVTGMSVRAGSDGTSNVHAARAKKTGAGMMNEDAGEQAQTAREELHPLRFGVRATARELSDARGV